jgi:hypothetical protein
MTTVLELFIKFGSRDVILNQSLNPKFQEFIVCKKIVYVTASIEESPS